jgi:ferredoxin
MIVAERKLFDQIWERIKDYKKVVILGCGTCVSVCQSGGEKEVELLASELRMRSKLENKDIEIKEMTIERQCDHEFIEPVLGEINDADAVLSMACGAGVQFVSDIVETVPLIPALNTRFIGVTAAEGTWMEKCRACGSCVLADYGGICPVTICAKGLLNGPCGGSRNGKCEASNEKDCAWVLIYNRLKKQDRLDVIRRLTGPKDYSAQAHPGRYINESYTKPVPEEKSGK